MSLVTCATCDRHIRRSELRCPFCGMRVDAAVAATPERPAPTTRLSRAALAVFTATTVGVGCGGRATETVRGDAGSTGGSGKGGVGAAPGTGGASVGAGGVLPSAGGVPASGGMLGAGGIAIMYGPAPFNGGFPGAGGSGGAPNGGSSGAVGAAGAAASDGGALDAGPDGALNCVDDFSGGSRSRCCPVPTPDCTKEPDGYPGYSCTPPPESFCSCSCRGGKWICAC